MSLRLNHYVSLRYSPVSSSSYNSTQCKDPESTLPLLNLWIYSHDFYSLLSLKFTHLWHKGLLPDIFRDTFLYAGDVHNYNTRYATNQNLYKPRVRTNTGKQMISFKAIDLWKSIPQYLTGLNE